MKTKQTKKRLKLKIDKNNKTYVEKETREKLIKRYGKKYAYMNCTTIGCIFK